MSPAQRRVGERAADDIVVEHVLVASSSPRLAERFTTAIGSSERPNACRR